MTQRPQVRYEVSDGVIGEYTITGYFDDPLSAYRAFELCHGDFARGVAMVYRLDGDDEAYGVTEDGGIHPESRTIVPDDKGAKR